MTKKEKEIRRAVGDLVRSAGCSCCRNDEGWEDALERLGKLLNIPKFDDGSGYNFWQVATKRKGD